MPEENELLNQQAAEKLHIAQGFQLHDEQLGEGAMGETHQSVTSGKCQ